MNLKEILCENIVIRRKNLGITQAALAERLRISSEAMTRIEKGQISPRLSRLESIAENLRCSVSDLFRPYKMDDTSRAETIKDAISDLPEQVQDALVNLVVHAAQSIRSSYGK